jgi:eukaryotic-like serine/threonine-protein kinase
MPMVDSTSDQSLTVLGVGIQLRSGTVYQFGPFEVDSSSGELLKNGSRIKLQDQPYRLLVALLENPGEVISREELRNRLWHEDTFVDFENGLRVAVRKLREALGNDAENPRYVETIPKRGYRFLAAEVHLTQMGVIHRQKTSPLVPSETTQHRRPN